MNLTSEAAQKYARIALYWIAGALVNHGLIKADPGATEAVIGALLTVGNLGWTLWGGRIQAKINEVAKLGVVKRIVVTDPEVAQAAPGNVIHSL